MRYVIPIIFVILVWFFLPTVNATTQHLSQYHNHYTQQKLANLVTVHVVITKNGCNFGCFEPCITVIPGGTVMWVNLDSYTHMVTSGSPDGGPSGWFSGVIEPNGKFSNFFDRIGVYPYYDNLHPWLKGVVIAGPLDSDYVYEERLFYSSYC